MINWFGTRNQLHHKDTSQRDISHFWADCPHYLSGRLTYLVANIKSYKNTLSTALMLLVSNANFISLSARDPLSLCDHLKKCMENVQFLKE